MTSARHHVALVHQVELKHHAEVGEVLQPGHRVSLEAGRIESDDGLDGTPIIIDGLGAAPTTTPMGSRVITQ
jgi:hypothetical protein